MKKLQRSVVAILFLASVAPVVARTAGGAGEIIEQVLVKVNGDIITKTELETRQIAALRQRDVDPKALQNDEQLKKALAEVTPRLLVDAIDELLMIQLGREKNYRLTDDQFNRWLGNLRKEQNLEDDKKFQDALKQEGLSVADLRKNVERQFVINQVQQDEVGSKLQITEEEARQYYQAHQTEFVEPASVTLREILIEVPTSTQKGQAGISVGQDDEIAAKAAEVRKRIAGGEDFAKVASEVSTAPSKANGGLIGPIVVAELSPALQKQLETLKPGDVTEPQRIPRGYQIIKLETSKASAVQAFENVRDVVADRVYSERQRNEVRKFLNRVRSQAIIVWKNDELRKAYEQHLATMTAAPAGAQN
jgi:parvulin-like peptidyl-prolyl isomerase